MLVWKKKEGSTVPVQVECEVFGYPNMDADGDQMKVNSHFTDKEECWKSLRSNARARVVVTGESVIEARERLRLAEVRAADAAAAFSAIETAYEADHV